MARGKEDQIENADVGDVVPGNPGPGSFGPGSSLGNEDQNIATANLVATERKRRRNSGQPKSRKDLALFVFFHLEDGEGNEVTVPEGTELVVDEVSRDIIDGYRRARKSKKLHADIVIPSSALAAAGGNAPGGNPATGGDPVQAIPVPR